MTETPPPLPFVDAHYQYQHQELYEPEWRRWPAWQRVSAADWYNAQWQRAHSIKNIRQLREITGSLIDESFFTDLQRDQASFATMAMLLTPQQLSTIASGTVPGGPGSLTDAVYHDPIRRYMLPVFSDRRADYPTHPKAGRDSLHEKQMWAVEGLTHRYPTKVLAEVVPTCPQYCGHCTRMDLVGTSTAQTIKTRFSLRPDDRLDAIIHYLARTPQVRDVVVSGGDIANLPWPRLEDFVTRLLELGTIHDIRLASKSVMALPQHWLQTEVLRGVERLTKSARKRHASISVHTHVNAAASLTPAVARAARALLDVGVRDVRNQAVLLHQVNDTLEQQLDLAFALLDGASITPYYVYLCDMIPNSEHWRTTLATGQDLQHAMMGYLPGFATPRFVCDVADIGKRLVHQAASYDRERGISWWSPSCHITGIDGPRGPGIVGVSRPYYDPLHMLPDSGLRWWTEQFG
ncbi:KamA family radical SAM protein [Streptomyces lavendulae]|uniref:KamA family radical SAM protein n=1 Tax=Streptomyces lavendulae TaxID=1914 RepID=UPI00340F9EDE